MLVWKPDLDFFLSHTTKTLKVILLRKWYEQVTKNCSCNYV